MKKEHAEIKRYIRAVRRRLRLPREIRDRVMSDFESSIAARMEEGQTVPEILAELGMAKEAAAELNGQMGEFAFRKSPWWFACLALAVLSALALGYRGVLGLLVKTAGRVDSAGIIGGADGPTAIFVTTSDGNSAGVILALVLLTAGLFGFWRLGRCKKRGGDV